LCPRISRIACSMRSTGINAFFLRGMGSVSLRQLALLWASRGHPAN
jgi:hypothetical protein